VPSRERIFTNRKRKIFRKRIPVRELAWSAVVVLAMGAAAWWVAAQKHAYDPAERDVSMAVLEAGAVEDTLYKAPLQLWVEPGSVVAGAAAPQLGIFPAGILDGSWQPSSRLQEFDADTLYEKINGAAEQYLQFGFERLHYLSLLQPAEKLDVGIELYDMGEFKNALGIFSAQRSPEHRVQVMGGAVYYPTPVGAAAFFGPYYLKIAGNDTGAKEKATSLVREIAAIASGDEVAPAPFLMLTAAGIPFESISYENENVFQYSFARDFWFGKPDPDAFLRYYIHEAGGEAEAKALFDQLLAAHTDWDYSAVSQGDTGALLKHNFIEAYLSLEWRGGLVYGVEHAPDLDAARKATEKLAGALHDGQSEEA
jgi:hypothetical protein